MFDVLKLCLLVRFVLFVSLFPHESRPDFTSVRRTYLRIILRLGVCFEDVGGRQE